MRSLIPAALVAAITAVPMSALSSSPTDPPLGVISTTVTLAQVIYRHERAVGGSHTILSESWILEREQLQGAETDVISGDDYREDIVLGPLRTASGTYRGQAWDQDANGAVVQLSGIHRRNENDAVALQHALSAGSGVTLIGETVVPSAYVLKVAPQGGRVEYVFYDKTSCLIIRTERAVEDRRVVTTYDDFRTTDGQTRAWHVHETDGRPFNDIDWKLQSLDYYHTPVDPARLQPPATDSTHFKLASPKALLPGKILADRVILTATVKGRKVNFQLDTGASDILLDRSIVTALNLPEYGKSTETTAGTYTSAHSIIPLLEFGDAALENVAVQTAPFHWWDDESTPIAGLLGYDFISKCVIHIDYVRGRAEALDPGSFEQPIGAIVIPIRLDDRVPVINLKIAATSSERFILDTGADRSMLFSAFVTAHPSDTQDQGLGELFSEAYPFAFNVSGVGGEIKVTHVQVPSLAIGSATFPRWLFSVVHDAPGFEGEDYDGLIGQDVLRNFDVYLDYPHQKIYLVPNDRYFARWGR